MLNVSAAASLAEGLEETLTLHRLGMLWQLGGSFKTMYLIESGMARLEARTHRVTHWWTSDQKLRGCAAGQGIGLDLLRLASERLTPFSGAGERTLRSHRGRRRSAVRLRRSIAR